MDQLKEKLQCQICLTSYNANDHYPLVLGCGHNICPLSFDKIFANNSISCPCCKKSHNCTRIEDMPKNFALIDILNLENSQEEKYIAIDISSLNISSELDQLYTIIQKIQNENKLINTYFDAQIEKIKKQKDQIIKFNNKLAIGLQSYSVLAKKQFNVLFNNSFKKIDFDKLNELEQKQKAIDEEISKIKIDIKKNVEQHKYVTIDQIENSVSFYLDLNFEKISSENLVMQKIAIVDYMNLCDNIVNSIDQHYTLKRNYQIKKTDNIEKVLEILEENAVAGEPQALLSLGFLYYNGILLQENKTQAMKQFQKAAGKGESRALFIYSELCNQNNPIKYEFLTQAMFKLNPSAINRFGVMIATGMITSMAKNQKSAYFYYSEAAKSNVPVAKYNVAENFELGRGVGQNIDKAARYYHELIEDGFFDAKKKLFSL